MCGVIALVQTAGETAPKMALSALKTMEYRGYDSWGVAWGLEVDQPQIPKGVVHKQVGQIGNAVLPKTATSAVAIGHTRWATHGGVSVVNAHPHLSQDGRFALVHNGVVENFLALKQQLTTAGYTFISQTDTEVIVALWQQTFAKHTEFNRQATDLQLLLKTAATCSEQLTGSNAFVVLDFQTQQVVAVRCGSPLFVAKTQSGFAVVSDVVALPGLGAEYAALPDNAMVAFSSREAMQQRISGQKLPIVWQQLAITPLEIDKGQFAHFLEKEMYQSSQVLATLAHSDSLQQQLQTLVRSLKKTIYLVGCGSAYHAALYGAALLTQLTNKKAYAFNANEFTTWLPKKSDISVIFISQSGETADVLVHARTLHSRRLPFIAIVNRETSTLASLAKMVVPILAGTEQAVVASKSFIAQMAVLYVLARQLELAEQAASASAVGSGMKPQADWQTELVQASQLIPTLLDALKTQSEFQRLVRTLAQCEHVYILGRGSLYAIALETALKLKEAAYLHAEGFAAGELKHGVLALIESGTAVVALATDPEQLDLDASSTQEVLARGGVVTGIVSQPESWVTPNVVLPHHPQLFPLLTASAGQLLAYQVAVAKRCNPDKPRNLAKSVTVR